MSKFNPGDRVRLISGGPVMTVRFSKGEPEIVRCTWFAGEEHKKGQFPVNALELADATAAN